MPVLDIDGDGTVAVLTDGLLILRYLNGVRGEELIDGALDSGATRTTPAEIIGYIEDIYERLDVDGNGEVTAHSDGLLIFLYLFGFTGDQLIDGKIEPGAKRHTSATITAYIDTLL